MKFDVMPLDQAVGKILGHNISGPDGRRLFRKGIPLSEEDVVRLREIGRHSVYVAELEANDVGENQAAFRIAEACKGDHLYLSKPTTGRANLHTDILGLLRVDIDRLMQINLLESITLATGINNAVVTPRQMVATLKVIAYGVSDNTVREAERIGRAGLINGDDESRLLSISPLTRKKVGLILSGSHTVHERIVKGFEKALIPRLQSWGSDLDYTGFIALEDESDEIALANEINRLVEDRFEMIILAGETAIMDRFDIAPRAVERSGGRVTCFGAPVDPGNLLMLARHDQAGYPVQIIGAPGCARSQKRNIVDLIIPRLLAGDYLTKMDIVQLGMGGMLDDVSERGRPRRLN
ncbi:MAG: molybdopterin-binding protein [Chloroflexota bacterium]